MAGSNGIAQILVEVGDVEQHIFENVAHLLRIQDLTAHALLDSKGVDDRVHSHPAASCRHQMS
jgi:hypothetical protein